MLEVRLLYSLTVRVINTMNAAIAPLNLNAGITQLSEIEAADKRIID